LNCILNCIWWFFYRWNFQETYNSRLRERYGDNPSTHPDFDPDLWMEAGSSGGPDKNRVYGLSNTTAENLRSTHNVSTIGSSPSVSNTQSEEFIATELATEMGFTDDCYTDGTRPSVSPSVLFSLTDFIAVTDGMSPSVKLDNVVV